MPPTFSSRFVRAQFCVVYAWQIIYSLIQTPGVRMLMMIMMMKTTTSEWKWLEKLSQKVLAAALNSHSRLCHIVVVLDGGNFRKLHNEDLILVIMCAVSPPPLSLAVSRVFQIFLPAIQQSHNVLQRKQSYFHTEKAGCLFSVI